MSRRPARRREKAAPEAPLAVATEALFWAALVERACALAAPPGDAAVALLAAAADDETLEMAVALPPAFA